MELWQTGRRSPESERASRHLPGGRRPHVDELERRKELLEPLFNHAPDVVVVADGDGRITEVNAQVERVLAIRAANWSEFRSRSLSMNAFEPLTKGIERITPQSRTYGRRARSPNSTADGRTTRNFRRTWRSARWRHRRAESSYVLFAISPSGSQQRKPNGEASTCTLASSKHPTPCSWWTRRGCSAK